MQTLSDRLPALRKILETLEDCEDRLGQIMANTESGDLIADVSIASTIDDLGGLIGNIEMDVEFRAKLQADLDAAGRRLETAREAFKLGMIDESSWTEEGRRFAEAEAEYRKAWA
jgi:hypothetical protein